MNEIINKLAKKIFYQASYRGTKEMDILLKELATKVLAIKPDLARLNSFAEFLALSDTQINDYLQNQEELPTKFVWITEFLK